MKKTHKKHHSNRPQQMEFVDLQIGDHFIYGEAEHVRLPIVAVTGGYFNAAQLGSGQVSGFGPGVEVVKIHHEKKSYNGFFFE